MATNNKLKAYVRYDGTGRVIAGSLILQRFKPKVVIGRRLMLMNAAILHLYPQTVLSLLQTLQKVHSLVLVLPLQDLSTSLLIGVMVQLILIQELVDSIQNHTHILNLISSTLLESVLMTLTVLLNLPLHLIKLKTWHKQYQ